MKYPVNNPCPCGSKKKYKQCCQKYHKGARCKDALSLMKARYSAYATANANFIIQSTHPDNKEYKEDHKSWKKEIETFSLENTFISLTIVKHESTEYEATVHFIAMFLDGKLEENSFFIKENDTWFYKDGEIKL